MIDLTNFCSQFKIVIYGQIPLTHRRFEKHDDDLEKVSILGQFAEDENSYARKNEQLNEPKHHKNAQLFQHHDYYFDHGSESFGQF